MAYTDIDKPSDYFNTVLYTGNGGTQSITGVGFAPNLVWGKSRSITEGNAVTDTVRGVRKNLLTNSSAAEEDIASITAFGSDGFTLGNNAHLNANNSSMVAWNWKKTADAGFDIVSYTGNGSGRTISHSLSAVPNFMILKNRDANGRNWPVYFGDQTKYMYLSSTDAQANAGTIIWNNTAPTSSVFSVGNDNGVNQNGEKYIAYLFAEKQGYSKFGSYVGNGNVDGTFIWTGQKSAFIMIKATSGTENWRIYDNRRNGFNVDNEQLFANTAAAEASDADLDILSNGFKCRRNSGGFNNSGTTYIFMAFAKQPLVTSTGVPATAK